MRRIILPCLAIVTSIALAGCADKPWLMEQSSLESRPIALVEGRYLDKKPLADLGDSEIKTAVDTYGRNGAGPLYVVVGHSDQDSKGGQAAEKKLEDITKALRMQGLDPRDIVASTVPLTTDTPVALIAFDTLEAQAPEGCTDMPGHKNLPGKPSDFDYKIGCTVKSYIARQIENPNDLKGVAGVGGFSDGEHAANVINENTRSGQARPFLPSYVISTLAGSGG